MRKDARFNDKDEPLVPYKDGGLFAIRPLAQAKRIWMLSRSSQYQETKVLEFSYHYRWRFQDDAQLVPGEANTKRMLGRAFDTALRQAARCNKEDQEESGVQA